MMVLSVVWFILVAVLWAMYLVLEGFDFGVGMLLRVVGKTPTERTAVVRTIGPHWDGNEVWLLTAGGAMFAAFPLWYASMFSGMYLALFVVLVLLIVRIAALEWRSKVASQKWRSRACRSRRSQPRWSTGPWPSRRSRLLTFPPPWGQGTSPST